MKNIQRIGLLLFVIALGNFAYVGMQGKFTLSYQVIEEAIQKPYHREMIKGTCIEIIEHEIDSRALWLQQIDKILNTAQMVRDDTWKKSPPAGVSEWDFRISDGEKKGYRYSLTRAAQNGYFIVDSSLWLFLTFGLAILGALMYILPKARELPGIKNNGIYHSGMHSRGLLGIITGAFLIGFYILLYWYPEYLTSWINLVSPISRNLSGNAASQWFLYGLLYTACMMVMGIRMFIKYRHNKYQMIRTGSVVFFQTIFAFLIPELLVRLNKPYVDFKNMWPLDYSFFFDYRIDEKLNSGSFGIFALFWGILLFLIGVPLMTYFFGKRWYCSWVCGCGGLAETLGDPYRQLSSKKLSSWQIERWLIHSVMVFAIVMTIGVLYTYFTGSSNIGPLASYDLRKWYGFMIGSVFSGVVGTGFYPLMGARVWCRFGCPLSAYLGLVQRFKSRFRITVNGGQCISCGNCSTYCEMGIDVRAYAQKGQDIVRASCVGCGICSAVCPRGVLKLENGDDILRTAQLRTVHIPADKVGIL